MKSKMTQNKEAHLKSYYYDARYTLFEFHADFRKKFKALPLSYVND